MLKNPEATEGDLEGPAARRGRGGHGCALAVGLLVALAAGARAAGPAVTPAVIAPGKTIWRGFAAGLDPRSDGRAGGALLELAPDGRSFLYYQGDPWPRLMRQPAGGGEPIMLGTWAPLPGRSPRFDPDGRRVFFTADLAWRPRRPPPPGTAAPDRAVEPVVAVVGAGGEGQQRVRTGIEGTSGGAVFLDLHPVGDTVLVGMTGALQHLQTVSGDYRLDIREVPAAGGEATPLGFSVSGGALVRYSWDGTAIYYTSENAWEDAVTVFRYDRRTGLHDRLAIDAPRCGRLAGDLEAGEAALAHLGATGIDPATGSFLAASLDEPAVLLRLDALPEGGRIGSPRVHSIRGGRVLLTLPPQARPRIVVASFPREAFDGVRRALESGAAYSLDPWSRAARAEAARSRSRSLRRATATAEAEPLLEALRRSLIPGPAGPVEAIAVTWSDQRPGPGDLPAVEVAAIDVIETAAGAVRIERTAPAPAEGDAPAREVVTSADGLSGRRVDDRGRGSALSRLRLLGELAVASPYRLLLDPAGLAMAGLRFELAPAPAGSSGEERALVFRHADGFTGRLIVRQSGGETLPARIETALPAAVGPSRGPGSSRAVVFDDFRTVAGHRVPHAVRIDTGADVFRLEVKELRFNPEIDDAIFTDR